MLPSVFGENVFDQLMNPSFDRDLFSHDFGSHKVNLMKTDVKENDEAYEMTIDLPGYHKEDIDVQFDKGMLSITAKRSDAKDEKDEDGKFIRRERYYGSCTRQFYVGDTVRKDDIKANMKDGVLALTIPKKGTAEIEESKRILIGE